MNEPIHVAWISLGCPKNLVDSESMLAELAQAGCLVAAPMDDADVIVINTCGFLAAARNEALDTLAEAVEHKRTGRTRRIVIAGCMPSYLRSAREDDDVLAAADAIVGVHDRHAIVDAVRGERPFRATGGEATSPPDDAGRFSLTPPHTRYLRIAEGCSRSCTFCAIPVIRGPFRSKSTNAILDEARSLIEGGALELNLIAQDTTAWGEDLPDPSSLAALLRRLDALDGVEWLRLMYTYPRRFDEELIDTLSSANRLVPYIDMPLQHIATGVLRRMGRGVTRSDVERLLESLRDRIDGLILRSSFIVGFPGETDEDFEQLLEFVETFGFDTLGVFEFSPEPGTAAAAMDGAVPDEVVAERAERLMTAQQESACIANQSLIDAPITVLVDGVDERGRAVGRYYGQAPDIDGQCILTDPRPAGRFVEGTIVDADAYDLIVQPTDNP